MKKVNLILFITIVFLISACVKETVKIEREFMSDLPPGSLYVAINYDDSLMSANTAQSAQLFYIENGERVYYTINPYKYEVFEDSVSLGTAKDSFMENVNRLFDEETNIAFWQFLIHIYSNESRNWYMEYSNGDIDTFTIFIKEVSAAEGLSYPCQCRYPIIEFKYNGEDIAISGNHFVPMYEVYKND